MKFLFFIEGSFYDEHELLNFLAMFIFFHNFWKKLLSL